MVNLVVFIFIKIYVYIIRRLNECGYYVTVVPHEVLRSERSPSFRGVVY